VLLGAAYPPFHLFIPSFVCLIPAVWLLVAGAEDVAPARRQFAQGFWFGLLTHGCTLYWMVVALWHFTPLSGAAYGATIVVLALYTGVVFAVSGWLTRRTRISLAVTLPVLWTGAEWVFAHHLDLRFPWLGLGTSLTGYPVVVQIADVIGARGVTFLLVLANVVLAQAFGRDRSRRYVITSVGAVMGVLLLAVSYGVMRERTLPLKAIGRAALLQPNIGWSEKWDPGARDSVFGRTLSVAERASHETELDLVVWPEAAVPGYLRTRESWRRQIAAIALAARVPHVVGGLDLEWIDPEGGSFEYFNAAFVFDSLGRDDGQPVYRKRYLVPVAERVPFLNPRWFDIEFFGGFRAGHTGPLFETAMGRFGVLICFESAFENLSRRYRAEGADFLVNMTNDSWFGRTSAPFQHVAHLVMRAIETRAGIVRAANSGISEFVDPLGRQHGRTGLFVTTVVTGDVVTSDVIPPYVHLGDWVGALSLVMTVMLVAFAARRRP
jgi:apolipoprotein N-acyltransferase